MATGADILTACRAHLLRGKCLDVPVFLQWFDEWKGDGQWINGKDEVGRTALYLAVLHNVPDEVTIALLNASNSAAKELNPHGSSTLYLALTSTSSEAVTLAILKAWKDAAKKVDKFGDYPLHLALKIEMSTAVKTALLEAWPGVVQAKNADGELPLFLALTYNNPVETTLSILNSWTGAAREKDMHGESALIMALTSRADTPDEIRRAVLEAWPAAAKEMDADGELPLHLALTYKVSGPVTIAVLHAWKDAAKAKDADGNYPLLLALKINVPEEVRLAVLEAWPGAAKEKDADGNYPLHLVIEWYVSQRVLAALHNAWPGAATEQYASNGDTPLHRALASPKVPEEGVISMIEVLHVAEGVQNNYGETQIDVARRVRASESVMLALSEAPRIVAASPSVAPDHAPDHAFAPAPAPAPPGAPAPAPPVRKMSRLEVMRSSLHPDSAPPSALATPASASFSPNPAPFQSPAASVIGKSINQMKQKRTVRFRVEGMLESGATETPDDGAVEHKSNGNPDGAPGETTEDRRSNDADLKGAASHESSDGGIADSNDSFFLQMSKESKINDTKVLQSEVLKMLEDAERQMDPAATRLTSDSDHFPPSSECAASLLDRSSSAVAQHTAPATSSPSTPDFPSPASLNGDPSLSEPVPVTLNKAPSDTEPVPQTPLARIPSTPVRAQNRSDAATRMTNSPRREFHQFQPMEDRGDIGTFQDFCDTISSEISISGEGLHQISVSDLRNEARAFLKCGLDRLRDSNIEDLIFNKRRLEGILNRSQKLYLRSYQSAMVGIVEEPLFDDLAALASTVGTPVCAEFGPRPKQREEAAINVEVLYADADRVCDTFLRFLQDLRHTTHNKQMYVKQHKGNVFTIYDPTTKKLVLKNEARVLVKTGMQPGVDGMQFRCDYCCDIVRGGIVFENISDIKFALEMVIACDSHLDKGLDKGTFAHRIRITRIENRFHAPTSGGWGDVRINFYFEDDVTKHIVELKLMHDRMMTVQMKNGAQAARNQARTATELLKALGVPIAPQQSYTPPRKHRVTLEQVTALEKTVDVLKQDKATMEVKMDVLVRTNLNLEERFSELKALFTSEVAAIRQAMVALPCTVVTNRIPPPGTPCTPGNPSDASDVIALLNDARLQTDMSVAVTSVPVSEHANQAMYTNM